MVNPLRPPPEVVASWPMPNYIDPDERGPGLSYCAVILASFGVIVVFARIYSRIFITRAPGIDDVLIVLAMFLGLALTVLVCIGNLRYHSGRHIWDIPLGTASEHRLNIWVSQWCYLTSTTCIKISVLLFYRRLSVTFSRGFWWATWIGIWYNVLQTIAFCCVLLLLCKPIEAYWLSFDRVWALENQGNFRCARESISLTMSAVVSVVGDFYAAVLPSVLIIGLNLTRQKKVEVGALFAVGYVVVGLGIGRCIMLNRVVMHDFDYTRTLWSMWVWSLCELWIGLLAASAPALKPFLKRFLVDPLSSAMSTTARNSQGQKKGRIDQPPDSTRRPVRSWNWLSPVVGHGGFRSPLSPPPKQDPVVLDDSASSTQLKSNAAGARFIDLESNWNASPDPRSAQSSPRQLEARPAVPPKQTYQYIINTDPDPLSATIDSRLAAATALPQQQQQQQQQQRGGWERRVAPGHISRCWSPASAPTQMEHPYQYRRGEYRNLEALKGARFSVPLPAMEGQLGTAGGGGGGDGVDSDAEWHGRERERRRSNRRQRWDLR